MFPSLSAGGEKGWFTGDAPPRSTAYGRDLYARRGREPENRAGVRRTRRSGLYAPAIRTRSGAKQEACKRYADANAFRAERIMSTKAEVKDASMQGVLYNAKGD